MWSIEKSVIQIYSTHHTQNAWINIQSLGWRKVRTGATDGVNNMLCLLSAARVNGRTVNVFVVNDLIERAYMN